MPYKVLGQRKHSTDSDVSLYTVPAGKQTVCSSLLVCNQSSTSTTFRVAVRPAGETLEEKHYIYYDVLLAGNDTFAATLGLSLGPLDVVSVRNASPTLSFNLFGVEGI